MIVLVQVEPAGISCYAGFCVHDVFLFENWKKKNPCCMLIPWFEHVVFGEIMLIYVC